MPDNGNKQDDVQRHKSGRYKKGTVSPNPAGRPVKIDSLTGLLREYIGCADPGARTHRENIVYAIVALAEKGDIPAIKLVWDRCEGLLTQQVEQLSKIEVEYVTDWDGNEPVDEVADTGAVPESD